GAHTTADDPTKYRDKAEEEIWEDRDPVTRLKAYHDKHTDTSDDFFAEVDAEADTLAARIRRNCMSMEDPDGGEMVLHVTSQHDDTSADFFAEVDAAADTVVARILHNCMSMEAPDGVEMFAHVTSEPPSLVDEERAEYLAYQASFADAGEA